MKPDILSHFKKTDPIMYKLAVGVGPLNLSKGGNPYLKLVESIINQQLSGKAADTIFSRVKTLFKNGKITPEDLLRLADTSLRKQGLSYGKIKYLKDLSTHVVNKTLLFDAFPTYSNEQIIDELVKVKGIGRWTAEMFLMFNQGREDVFSTGDLGLRRAVEKYYRKGKEVSSKQLEKISRKWSPYRSFASMILWRSLDKS